jgi:hypothetical protein
VLGTSSIISPIAAVRVVDVMRPVCNAIACDFLNEDTFGQGPRRRRSQDSCGASDRQKTGTGPQFNLDFNTAFATGPARPHGLALDRGGGSPSILLDALRGGKLFEQAAQICVRLEPVRAGSGHEAVACEPRLGTCNCVRQRLVAAS